MSTPGHPSSRAPSLAVLLGSAMGLRLAMAALNFSLFWLLSHELPTTELGGFALLMNLFLMLQLLPLLGLSVPLVRRAATERERLAVEVSNAVVLALPVAVLLAAGVWFWGHHQYGAELTLPLLLMALTLLPGAWILVAESSLLGLERMTSIARVQAVEVAVRVLLSWVLVKLGAGLTGVFAVLLLGRVGMAVVYATSMPGLPRPRWALVDRAVLRRNLSEVPTFLGIALMAALVARLDQLLLSNTQGLAEVGVYAAAARLYDAALMLPTVAALTMMPTLARLFQEDPQQFGVLLRRAVRASLAVGTVLALGVAALAPALIGLLYQPALHAAAPVLAWLIFAAVLTTVDQVLSSTMMAAKAQMADMRSLLVGLLVLLPALWVLSSRWGATGAAAAVLLALVARVAWRMRWAGQALPVQGLGGEGLRQGALAAVCAALSWQAGQALGALAGLAIAWLVWGLLARLSGVIRPQDWQMLCSAVTRVRGRLRRAGT